ncbi:hypothetical protein G9A89_016631 [Geosiphon pyriformis]|nr:hypothetical protein G9A89_016631 [Geosiphon pyriformis]
MSLVSRVRQETIDVIVFVAQVLRNVTVDESIVTSAHNHELKKEVEILLEPINEFLPFWPVIERYRGIYI